MTGLGSYGNKLWKTRFVVALSGIMSITLLAFLYINCGQYPSTTPPPDHGPPPPPPQSSVLPCFFQTSWNVYSQSYYGNGTSHSSGTNPNAKAPYNQTGSNFFIFIGPAFYVQSQCNSSHISFVATNVDPLVNHYICSGGSNPGSSCTLVKGSVVSPNPLACKNFGTCGDPIPNTYDLGLYCVGGGDCVYGQLYAETGPLDVPHFFKSCSLYSPPCYTHVGQNHSYQVDLNFKNGSTILPSGDYAIGMASNCDDGAGDGGGLCGLGLGEGGPPGYNGGAGSSVTKAGTELMRFKYFTGMYDNHTGCLLYDPNHDNTIGLPPTLTAYDSGTCTAVNSGTVAANVQAGAPHILNYVIW